MYHHVRERGVIARPRGDRECLTISAWRSQITEICSREPFAAAAWDTFVSDKTLHTVGPPEVSCLGNGSTVVVFYYYYYYLYAPQVSDISTGAGA